MHVEHAVEIAAAPSVVWAVTVDVTAWPAWTPTVRAVEVRTPGPVGVGTRAHVVQTTGDAAEWTVTTFEPEHAFVWETRRPGGVRVVASHHLSPTAGGTRNVLRVEASGWAARVAWPLVRAQVAGAIAQENAGLKVRCESLASGGV